MLLSREHSDAETEIKRLKQVGTRRAQELDNIRQVNREREALKTHLTNEARASC